LLLANIDQDLDSTCDINGGVRFIDDIELSFQRLADAEAALAKLEALLNEYELQLNANKTRIVALPESLDAPYATELRPQLPHKTEATRTQWTDFFNRAFALARAYPADGVLRYALATLRGVKTPSKHWSLVQSLLWQCIALDPGTIRFVIDVLWLNTHGEKNLELDDSVAETALEALIETSAPVGHGSEVVWSLWAAMLFELSLSKDALAALSMMDDSFVASAAFLAHKVKVFDEPPKSDVWKDWFTEDCFGGPHWLFTYEAFRNEWMEDSVKKAKLADNISCKFLKDYGVSFLRQEAIAEYKPKGAALILSGGGGAAMSL